MQGFRAGTGQNACGSATRPSLLPEPEGLSVPTRSVIELSSPAVGQFQADLLRAQKDLAVAKTEYERSRRLKESEAGSDNELLGAEAELAKAGTEAARSAAHLNASATGPWLSPSGRAWQARW